jgi:hypothetical protein
MIRFFERLQNVLAAIAFAEEGDADTARRLAAEGEPPAVAPRGRGAENEPPGTSPRHRAIPRRQGA